MYNPNLKKKRNTIAGKKLTDTIIKTATSITQGKTNRKNQWKWIMKINTQRHKVECTELNKLIKKEICKH